jgi:hypothetical protein
MSTDSLSAAASALISPTGQVGLTATLAGTELPALTPAPNSAQDWLSVVAAVRPALARLEAHQLTAEHPFATWVNRGDDVWPSSRSLPRSRTTTLSTPRNVSGSTADARKV